MRRRVAAVHPKTTLRFSAFREKIRRSRIEKFA